MRIQISVFACALLFTLPPLAGAAEPDVDFDRPGPAIDEVVSSIKADASSFGLRAAPPVGPVKAVKPLIVTVSGLQMTEISLCGVEFHDILKIWHTLFPNHKPDEEKLEAALDALRRDMRDPEHEKAVSELNYVETAVRDAALKNHLDADVLNFTWSRDPDETEPTILRFQAALRALRDAPETRERPLYIVAHSWGTVLMHETMARLELAGERVEVRRFVTLGSPLAPHRFWTKIFKKLRDRDDHLQRTVVKPKGVRHWVNLWAEHDPYSSSIPAADHNIRVDGGTPAYEILLRALFATPKKKEAKADLAALGKSGPWHFSYLYGFKAALKSLNKDASWDVLQTHAAQVLPLPTSSRGLKRWFRRLGLLSR